MTKNKRRARVTKRRKEQMINTYLCPLTDFGFKMLFGQQARKQLLIDFLNELLPISAKIEDLHFKNNEQLAQYSGDRNAVFDIYCTDEKGQEFIVEMQNSSQTFFKDRTVFYSTFPLQQQGKKGMWNFELKPVYCVGLLGFNMFGDPEVGEEIYEDFIHRVKLKDEKNRLFYDKLTYIFVELPKFEKTEEELVSRFDKWMYFLKNLEMFDEIPAILNEPVFKTAFDAAKLANYSHAERDYYERSLKSFRDSINVIEKALSDGLSKGMRKGMIKGLRLGKRRGMEQGLKRGMDQGLKRGMDQGLKRGMAEGQARAVEMGISKLYDVLANLNIMEELIEEKLLEAYPEEKAMINKILKANVLNKDTLVR